MLRNSVDAENEPKTGYTHVRLGPRTKDLLKHAAERHGISLARYLREAAVTRALAELGSEQPPADDS